MIIRTLQSDETAALSTLARITYAQAFGASMSAGDLETQLRQTRSEAAFADAFRSDTFLVAVEGGDILGYVHLRDLKMPIAGADASDVELFALYVRSADQGRGIGKALMAAALAHERVARAGRVYLDVWENNPRALGLYRRFGFREIGRRDFVVDGQVLGEDIVMVREVRGRAAEPCEGDRQSKLP